MRKLMTILTLLLMLVAAVVPASAQMPAAFCGDLSEADCQIFTAASEAMLQQESASIDMNLDMTVSNIPDAPFDSLAFNLSGQAVYHIEPGLMEKYAALSTDPSAMFADMSQLGTMMADLLNGFDGQVSLALTLPEELVEMAAESETTIPQTLSLELRLVDGIGYVNLSSLAESLPQEAGIPSGWYGLEIAKLMENVMNMAMSQMEDLEMFGADASTFSQFYDEAFLESYLTVERLADEDGAAVFQMTMDMAALAESEAFRDIMQQQMETTGQELSEADLQQMMDMIAQMYEGLDMNALYTIDLSDNTIRRSEMTMNWDLASMMAAMGEADTEAPTFDIVFSADYSDFNAAPAVTAPANASVMTAEQAMQMFMGSMSGASQK